MEALLVACTTVDTFDGDRSLTNASGFFFERDGQPFLVTSRHVFSDPQTAHAPNRVQFLVHDDLQDLTRNRVISSWLYIDGRSQWRDASDSGGAIDVAVLPIDRTQLPKAPAWVAFKPENLQPVLGKVEVGQSLLIPAFPLGFHDVRHHLPVVRQAIVASSFGIRFQGSGCFVTDARMHRGSSGAPVVMRDSDMQSTLPWKLLGIHSSRFDMQTRDAAHDEGLGLNCAWYADVLQTLTGGQR